MRHRGTGYTVLLLVSFLFLQIGGQVAAGFAGISESFFNPFLLVSYFCLFSRGFVWLFILRRIDLLTAYPFTGMIYIIILPITFRIFGDSISPARIGGAVLIFVGIMFTAVGAGYGKKEQCDEG